MEQTPSCGAWLWGWAGVGFHVLWGQEAQRKGLRFVLEQSSELYSAEIGVCLGSLSHCGLQRNVQAGLLLSLHALQIFSSQSSWGGRC